MMLFTDGSVRTQTGIGYGAFVALDKIDYSLKDVASRIQVKRFDYTSSTKLELETLLWALNEINPSEVAVYTDSQNIQSLLQRRVMLEKNDYYSKSGKLHKNWKLYKNFFGWMDRINFKVIKVSGHSPNIMKIKIDKIFKLVDKASRNALRVYASNDNISTRRLR